MPRSSGGHRLLGVPTASLPSAGMEGLPAVGAEGRVGGWSPGPSAQPIPAGPSPGRRAKAKGNNTSLHLHF